MPVLFLLSCAVERAPVEWYDDMTCQEVDDYLNLPVASEGETLFTQVELDVAANASAKGSELNLADCQSTNRDVIDPAPTWWDVCGDWVAISGMLTECEQGCSKPGPTASFLECQKACRAEPCASPEEPGACAVAASACERGCPDYPVWDCERP